MYVIFSQNYENRFSSQRVNRQQHSRVATYMQAYGIPGLTVFRLCIN